MLRQTEVYLDLDCKAQNEPRQTCLGTHCGQCENTLSGNWSATINGSGLSLLSLLSLDTLEYPSSKQRGQ